MGDFNSFLKSRRRMQNRPNTTMRPCLREDIVGLFGLREKGITMTPSMVSRKLGVPLEEVRYSMRALESEGTKVLYSGWERHELYALNFLDLWKDPYLKKRYDTLVAQQETLKQQAHQPRPTIVRDTVETKVADAPAPIVQEPPEQYVPLAEAQQANRNPFATFSTASNRPILWSLNNSQSKKYSGFIKNN